MECIDRSWKTFVAGRAWICVVGDVFAAVYPTAWQVNSLSMYEPSINGYPSSHDATMQQMTISISSVCEYQIEFTNKITLIMN